MPMYEFHCRGCDAEFETLVAGVERVECPECSSAKLDRLWSVPAAPKVQGDSLPMSCDPSTPACGAGCRKLT